MKMTRTLDLWASRGNGRQIMTVATDTSLRGYRRSEAMFRQQHPNATPQKYRITVTVERLEPGDG